MSHIQKLNEILFQFYIPLNSAMGFGHSPTHVQKVLYIRYFFIDKGNSNLNSYLIYGWHLHFTVLHYNSHTEIRIYKTHNFITKNCENQMFKKTHSIKVVLSATDRSRI